MFNINHCSLVFSSIIQLIHSTKNKKSSLNNFKVDRQTLISLYLIKFSYSSINISSVKAPLQFFHWNAHCTHSRESLQTFLLFSNKVIIFRGEPTGELWGNSSATRNLLYLNPNIGQMPWAGDFLSLYLFAFGENCPKLWTARLTCPSKTKPASHVYHDLAARKTTWLWLALATKLHFIIIIFTEIVKFFCKNQTKLQNS